jgi:hypothetical protein
VKEIPILLVRANQFVLAVGTLLALVLQQGGLILVLFLLSLLPLIFGPQLNIVFILTKMLLRNRMNWQKTEAAELQRFNQTIATVLLGASWLILHFTGHWTGWILSGMVTVAAGLALSGFCIGCILYFQLKKWRANLGK